MNDLTLKATRGGGGWHPRRMALLEIMNGS